MNAAIKKIEYYLPNKILDNNQLVKEFSGWTTERIEEKIGIIERHIADENETAADLAFNVSKKILKDYDKNKIDFFILCTQSPDYFLPTSACILQDRLGLQTDIGALDINLGCSGYIYGLAISKSLIAAGIAKAVLLVMAETYSKHINPKDWSNRAIFGDGAAATIIENSDKNGIFEFSLGTDGSGYRNLIVPNGGFRHRYEYNAEEVEDPPGSYRTANDLYMNGPEIFNFTIKAVPKLVNEVLLKNNLAIEAVDYVIFHQANKYILDYLRKKIGIPKEKFFVNTSHAGNTVSATIPIALKDCLNKDCLNKGDKVLIVGFGVGYSYGGTIIEI